MKILRLHFIFLIALILLCWPQSSSLSQVPQKIFVRKVFIHGGHPYLTKKILRLSSVQNGDIFSEQALLETQERIKNHFIKDGYLTTEVSAKATPDKKNGFMNIDVYIKRGEHHRIGKINLTGNTVLTDKYIKNKIGQQARYSPHKIKQKIAKLEKKYSKKGFIRNRVKLESAKFNLETKKVDLSLAIKERKQLHLSFSGNRWFRDSTLLSQTAFQKEKSYDESSIEQTSKQIRLFYLINGFLETTLFYNVTHKQNDIFVTYHIEEGPRTRLKQIRLNGQKKLDKDKALANFISSPHSLTRQGFFLEAPIEADLSTLVTNYQRHGFFDFKIIDSRVSFNEFKDQATLDIDLSEGEEYKIGDIYFTGNREISAADLSKRISIKTRKPYEAEKIKKSADKLLKHIQSKGYPLASIHIEEIIHSNSLVVDINFQITEGPQVRVGQIILEGIYATQPKVVLEAVKIKTGDLFNYDQLLKGQFNLKRMDVFDHVSVTPLNLTASATTTDILVSLRERKRLTLDIQGGFDSDKLGNGELILTRRNVFGLGKHLQMRGIGGFELSRGEINFISPRLFGASWNLLNQYFVQYEDDVNFNAFSYGGSIGGLKTFGRDLTILLKAQINRFNLIENQSNSVALSKNLFDNTFAELLASVSYDTRDNYADPKKGFYTVASAELDSDLSDVTNDFSILKTSTSHYLTFFNRITLSNSLRIGDIHILTNGTRVPATKLFFLGGNDTIRGFNEDAILDSGGTKSVIYNAELAFRLADSIQIAGFADIGSLTDSFSDINQDTIRQSAGAGLRYMTPVGPIRLDYGFILDRQPSEPMGRLHFTFGYFF